MLCNMQNTSQDSFLANSTIICAFFGWRQRVDAPAGHFRCEMLVKPSVSSISAYLALYHHLHHGNASQLVPAKVSTSQQSVAACSHPLYTASHLLAAKMSLKNVRPQRQDKNITSYNPENQKSHEHNGSEKITQFGDDTWTSENKSPFWMIQAAQSLRFKRDF